MPGLIDDVLQELPKFAGWCKPDKAAWIVQAVEENKPTLCVELGVFGGGSLIPTAMTLRANGKGHVFGIDPWRNDLAVVGMGPGKDRDWWQAVDMRLIYAGCLGQIKRLGLASFVTLCKETSDEAVKRFAEESIGLLHIDANHCEANSFADATNYFPLVEVGGIIMVDDANWEEAGEFTQRKTIDWLEERCEIEGMVEGCLMLRKN